MKFKGFSIIVFLLMIIVSGATAQDAFENVDCTAHNGVDWMEAALFYTQDLQYANAEAALAALECAIIQGEIDPINENAIRLIANNEASDALEDCYDVWMTIQDSRLLPFCEPFWSTDEQAMSYVAYEYVAEGRMLEALNLLNHADIIMGLEESYFYWDSLQYTYYQMGDYANALEAANEMLNVALEQNLGSITEAAHKKGKTLLAMAAPEEYSIELEEAIELYRVYLSGCYHDSIRVTLDDFAQAGFSTIGLAQYEVMCWDEETFLTHAYALVLAGQSPDVPIDMFWGEGEHSLESLSVQNLLLLRDIYAVLRDEEKVAQFQAEYDRRFPVFAYDYFNLYH
jgi:tetratricopeptide (TPR) repeat protein